MPSSMDAVYEAVPLTSPTSFRLLELLDEDTSDDEETLDHEKWRAPISCRLYVADLRDRPPFLALSYMWGSPDATKTVLVNGQPYAIRQYLWDFLREWRYRRHGEVLIRDYELSSSPMMAIWVDAICIDQSIIPERNHQVSIMGEIYSNARLVISWLGASVRNGRLPTKWERNHLTPDELLASSDMDLYLHEYWTRVWIIQEVALPRHVEVWWGENKAMSLFGIEGMGRSLEAQSSSGEYKKKITGSPIRELLTRRQQLHSGDEKNNFISLLLLSSTSGCAQPKDRIYAVLPLMDVEERAKLDIYPDYSSSTEELFHEVVNKTIVHGNYVTEETRGLHVCLLLRTLQLDVSLLDQKTVWGRAALEQYGVS